MAEAQSSEAQASEAQKNRDAYWKANLKLVGRLMVVWFLVSFGAGILFVDQLNTVQIGGFKLGFWFAQQGSIFVFIALIFAYVYGMHRLDVKYGLDDKNEPDSYDLMDGQNTSGQNTSGQNTSGQNTSGQNTSGQNTSGQNTGGPE